MKTSPDLVRAEIPTKRLTTGHAVIDLGAVLGDRLGTTPYSLRLLTENVARQALTDPAAKADLVRLTNWPGSGGAAISLKPDRAILPDSSGLPVLLDLAALRWEAARRGIDPQTVDLTIPVDLVVDHSLIVEVAGTKDAVAKNLAVEFDRNGERYAVFKWAAQAFRNLRVFPPGTGIIHQVHLEHVAKLVATGSVGGAPFAFPEFVLGCDSHTPMVNGIGLAAWGVGGIEAMASILGLPYTIELPEIVGVRLDGALSPALAATDIALSLARVLREAGVVGAFVEFFGTGLTQLSAQDRATIANMTPEYGATMAYFPIDRAVLDYLAGTGREAAHIALVEEAAGAIGVLRAADDRDPHYSRIVEFDLSALSPSLAGPSRPDARLGLADVPASFAAVAKKGASRQTELAAGVLAIAAITACTITANAPAMLAAGLLARNARTAGLSVPGFVKTSLAPGSRVVARYLSDTGLLDDLEALGFHLVGFGCTTCSGKSGPLTPQMAAAIEAGLEPAAVLSGNRNFPGRIHRQIRASYLASPVLVIAYALAGRIDIDLTCEPIGTRPDGTAVYLRDLLPDAGDVAALVPKAMAPSLYRKTYQDCEEGTDRWRSLEAPDGPLFLWPQTSTYLKEPPFFATAPTPADDVVGARILAVFGDDLSTDHIIPAGEIPQDSEAGRYLAASGVPPRAFNAFTMRRGNHEVMARATFANPQTLNLMVQDRVGGFAIGPDGDATTLYEAAAAYGATQTPLVVFAGRNYGAGSSRDWAAKGPSLLGVRAVIATSFERIHRANLIGLGILPVTLAGEVDVEALPLTGMSTVDIRNVRAALAGDAPTVAVTITGERVIELSATIDVRHHAEATLLGEGGIFPAVMRTHIGSEDQVMAVCG